MLRFIILGFLCDQSMTGYGVKQLMMNSTSNFIDASFGSIYPALKRLENGGSISFVEIVEGGKYKKQYSITVKGKEEFLKWLREPCIFSPLNYGYLSKLFFYKHLRKDEIIQLINMFIGSVTVELEKVKKIEDKHKQCMGFFDYATLRFGKDYYDMIIKWYEKLIEEINKEFLG